MKIKILLAVILLTTVSFAQNIYEIQSGTKGNQIILSLSNISEIKSAENVKVQISKPSGNLEFSKQEHSIERIDIKVESEAVFFFDVKRDVNIGKKDTVEFTITDSKGVFKTKQFIFSYTGPKDYKLEQNFPNPFNPTTTIQYQLPTDSKVTLKVYDILGSEVATLVNEFQQTGYKEIKFDASALSSGIYIYRLTAQNYISTKKMLMVK